MHTQYTESEWEILDFWDVLMCQDFRETSVSKYILKNTLEHSNSYYFHVHVFPQDVFVYGVE